MERFAPGCPDSHYLIPLFWQRHDPPEAICAEMARMKETGINDFVVEPRPHPDYLGPDWWSDLDLILAQAEQLDMRVWLFDDGDYPSGKANGELAHDWPQYTKRYWAQCHMDASGPLPHAHFLIDDWLAEDEQLVRIVAGRRTDRDNMLDSDTLTDVTEYYDHGRLYWPVPEGEWRIFVIKHTTHGGEEHTRTYVDPMSHEAVAKYIELVHERHYARYARYFGNRIAGFFTDEPRFGNAVGYDRIIGLSDMPLPCTDGLLEELGTSPLGDFARWLPLLWYPDEQQRCRDARYFYMDVVSRRFARHFTGQLGDWCRAHGVELIGHVVEENGAHARLGYGAGHYFRAMRGLDAAGIDVVCNLLPEQTDGRYSTMFNYYDCDFNHWGLAKMASSAAHADPKKHGRALCEAFGAYGWFEGLKLMKWITDHLAVQGVGLLTPHAFSPAPFPDADCPPHFYARGNNPQFRHFGRWSAYANRLCGALDGAAHHAPAAVVYHAEAEWGSLTRESLPAQPFEKAVKALARRQIDCDVVCIDDLMTAGVHGGTLCLNGETFRVLVVPEADTMDAAFADRLRGFAAAGLPVLFTGTLPQHGYFGRPLDLTGCEVQPLEGLADRVQALNAADVVCTPSDPDLLVTHYSRGGLDWYLFVNQSTRRTVSTDVLLRDARPAVLYDAMDDRRWAAPQAPAADGSKITLRLAPWQSLFVVFGEQPEALPPLPDPDRYARALPLNGPWRISTAGAQEYPAFTPTPFTDTLDMSLPDRLPDFVGTVRYECSVTLPPLTAAPDAPAALLEAEDAGETVAFFVNDAPAGVCLTPPYRVFLPAGLLHEGENAVRIEVTNTVVKAQHRNVFDPYFVQDPTGLAGAVTLRLPEE